MYFLPVIKLYYPKTDKIVKMFSNSSTGGSDPIAEFRNKYDLNNPFDDLCNNRSSSYDSYFSSTFGGGYGQPAFSGGYGYHPERGFSSG